MRIMCEFCHERVPKNKIQLHYKRCINARRALKKSGFTKIETPSDLATKDDEESIDQSIDSNGVLDQETPSKATSSAESGTSTEPPENVEELIEEITPEPICEPQVEEATLAKSEEEVVKTKKKKSNR
ncbi:MAG: hypothetical protein HYS25_13775 [Ignavibacteriales bacterium]|nr:hypothetical protein [Ignavibacteriales bacterium]